MSIKISKTKKSAILTDIYLSSILFVMSVVFFTIVISILGSSVLGYLMASVCGYWFGRCILLLKLYHSKY